MKRTPMRRRAPLRAKAKLRRSTPLERPVSLAASERQRAAVAGRTCIVCGTDRPPRRGAPDPKVARRMR